MLVSYRQIYSHIHLLARGKFIRTSCDIQFLPRLKVGASLKGFCEDGCKCPLNILVENVATIENGTDMMPYALVAAILKSDESTLCQLTSAYDEIVEPLANGERTVTSDIAVKAFIEAIDSMEERDVKRH